VRTKNAIKTSSASVFVFLVVNGLSFFSRRLFVQYLGFAVLGMHNVFLTIIGTLNIVDLGIASAIVFYLYRPLAEGDHETVSALIRYYRKVFAFISMVVLALGLFFIPFLKIFTRNEFDLGIMLPYYLVFLIDVILSYVFSYNHALLMADQKGHRTVLISGLFTSVGRILQILVLVYFSSYFLFVLTNSIAVLLGFIVISRHVSRHYPYILGRQKELDSSLRRGIRAKTFALAYHRVGNYLVTGTDNLIISTTLGVTVLGHYSNFFMI